MDLKAVRWCAHKTKSMVYTVFNDGSAFFTTDELHVFPNGFIASFTRELDPRTFRWNADEWNDWQYPASE